MEFSLRSSPGAKKPPTHESILPIQSRGGAKSRSCRPSCSPVVPNSHGPGLPPRIRPWYVRIPQISMFPPPYYKQPNTAEQAPMEGVVDLCPGRRREHGKQLNLVLRSTGGAAEFKSTGGVSLIPHHVLCGMRTRLDQLSSRCAARVEAVELT